MELQASPEEFSDLVAFVDREVRIITNPIFVNISESSKPPSGSGPSAASNKTSKSRKISFLSQVDGAEAKPWGDPVSQCLNCNKNHALEDCHSVMWKPHEKTNQF